MKKMDSINYEDYKELIAPCGMNCGVCDKYLAFSHQLPKKRGKIGYCKGCRPQNKDCSFIKRKCKTKEIYEIGFCFECSIFPCETLECGSKKYKARYNYDFVESLYSIKKKGMRQFIENQVELHKCIRCGDTVCIHNQKCYSCDKDELIY